MSVVNQDNSEKDILHDPNTTLEFFKLFGKSESVNAGEIIFAQGEKSFFSFLHSEKMYLLCEGSVDVVNTASGKSEAIKIGGVFGAHTLFTARNFTAITMAPCQLMTLTEKQFLTGLQNKPEFLLMLMGLFVSILRRPLNAIDTSALPKAYPGKHDGVLSSKMLKELVRTLGHDAITAIPPQRVIFKEGGTAMVMYVILDGTLSTRIDDKIVNKSGPGDIVGEIALVDKKPRTASIVTETQSSLLAINRHTLLEVIKAMPDFGIALLRVLASRSFLHSSAPQPANKSAPQPADDLDWDWD